MVRKYWFLICAAAVLAGSYVPGVLDSGRQGVVDWTEYVLLYAFPGAVLGSMIVLMWNRRTRSGKSSESPARHPRASDPPTEY
ncbi:hypothetical protein Ntsu_13960 [Nocardia sp. IFM 10818]